MARILPYYELLINGDGGYISPDGSIELCYSLYIHEKIAEKICCGSIDKNLFIYDNGITFDKYDGNLNQIEFDLFKIWIKEHDKNHISLYGACSDFLLYVLGYDKVETIKKNAITTSNNDPHVRFYNYYIMNYDIIHLPKRIYNKDLGTFERGEYLYVPSDDDIEMEKEIKEIKEKVPLKERKLFLK